LDRLKSAGYINGYHADIALERLVDFTQVVVTVSLSQHRKTDFERFEAMVERLDEITFCVATGGGMDYVLHVVTPSLSAFQTLMDDILSEELSIDRYMTYIATRRIKSTPPNITKLISDHGP
ncbi:MAG: Lrp/AsnC family transcriptional regulator, partial [Pseudomonadota bacterium]